MRRKRIVILALMVIAGSLFLQEGTAVAGYPEKPIRVIVAYSAGGGTDVFVRLLCKYAEKDLGVPLVVENKAGASGEIGFTALALAEPDGYTIGAINTPTVVGLPIAKETKYKMSDFTPLVMVQDDPCVFAVLPSSPFKSLDDIVKAAKQMDKPYITFGSSGVSSDDHLSLLAFERIAGVKLIHIPFAGEAPAKAALLGGHVSIWGGNLGGAAVMAEAGEVRMLALLAKKRHPFAPDLSTAEEQGFPIYMESTRGIAAPSKTPKDRLALLMDAFTKARAHPEFQETSKKMMWPMSDAKGADYQSRLDQMADELTTLWKTHPWRE